MLKEGGYEVHIETSGVYPPIRAVYPYVDFWSLSPKMLNAGAHAYSMLNKQYLYNIVARGNRGQVKFVISEPKDVQEALGLLCEIFDDMNHWPVVFQLERFEATTDIHYKIAQYLIKMKDLQEWVRATMPSEFDVRILPQLHYLLWGGKKGV